MATNRGLVARALLDADRVPASAVDSLSDSPGLYAWWCDRPGGADDLGLGESGADWPLYVGLATRSIRDRVTTHIRPATQGFTEFSWRLGSHLALVTEAIPWWESLVVPRSQNWKDESVRPRAEFGAQSLNRWMGAACSVSVLPMGLAEARAAEGRAIFDLEPLLNIWGSRVRSRADGWHQRWLSEEALEAWIAVLHWDAIATILQREPEKISLLDEGMYLWVAAKADPTSGKIVDGRLTLGSGTPPSLAELKGVLAEDEAHLVLVGVEDEFTEAMARRAIEGPWGQLSHRRFFGDPPDVDLVFDALTEVERRIVTMWRGNVDRMRLLPDEYV